MARRRPRAVAPRKMSGNELLNGGRVDRASSKPAAEVLGGEDVLMENACVVPASTKVLDEPQQHRSDRVVGNARPDGGTTEEVMKISVRQRAHSA